MNDLFITKITLAQVFEFLCRNPRWPPKVAENDCWEKSPVDPADTLRVKNFVEIALAHSVSKINMFLHFMQKFMMAAKKGGKTIFGKSL